MNLREKEFRPWHGGYYMVSEDGYIYVTQSGRGGIAGRFLLPIWQNSTATVNIRSNGRAKQTAVSTATLETWGDRIRSTQDTVNEMREAIRAYHDKHLPLVTQAKRDAISKSILDKNEAMRSVMPCPWATPGKLDVPEPGVSWYSAQADPMTRGIWLEGNVETVKAKEKAA